MRIPVCDQIQTVSVFFTLQSMPYEVKASGRHSIQNQAFSYKKEEIFVFCGIY